MVMRLFGMDMPEPGVEGPVRISWRRSSTDSRKVVSTFEVDFGKTKLNPDRASDIELAIVRLLRRKLRVKLARHVT